MRNSEKDKLARARYRDKNRELLRLKSREYYSRTKEQQADYQRQYRKGSPEKALDTYLKNRYGISLELYKELEEKQNYVCAICFQKETENRTSRLSVDHCHDTGRVRGLLCRNCNRAIGLLKEEVSLLSNAINYLQNA